MSELYVSQLKKAEIEELLQNLLYYQVETYFLVIESALITLFREESYYFGKSSMENRLGPRTFRACPGGSRLLLILRSHCYRTQQGPLVLLMLEVEELYICSQSIIIPQATLGDTVAIVSGVTMVYAIRCTLRDQFKLDSSSSCLDNDLPSSDKSDSDIFKNTLKYQNRAINTISQ